LATTGAAHPIGKKRKKEDNPKQSATGDRRDTVIITVDFESFRIMEKNARPAKKMSNPAPPKSMERDCS
jgi:hypothetical protein